MSEQASSKIQKIFYTLLAAIILIPIIWLSNYILEASEKMVAEVQEINRNRDIAIENVSPALIRYRDEQGVFPDTLDKLVPNYITAIPEVLLITKDPGLEYDSGDMSTKYSSDGTTASFSFRRGYDHLPKITYDVLTGTYSDQK